MSPCALSPRVPSNISCNRIQANEKYILKERYWEKKPEKTADISRSYHWFPREMTSEKRTQKFHTDDASLHRSRYCFWLVVSREKFTSANQKHYPALGSEWRVISVEFLRSSLRRHFAGKPVVASRNVGCFLRLVETIIYSFSLHDIFYLCAGIWRVHFVTFLRLP